MRVETPHNRAGLAKDVVLRLLTCENRPDAKDRVKYEKSSHFLKLKGRVEEVYVYKDVVLLCQRCHGRYHRGHRGRG